MSTKECPSCGAEVPSAATRCKECFHDFSEDKAKGVNWLGPLFVLGTVAAMAVVGAVVLAFVFMQPVEQRVLVDEDTRSVVWTTRYRTGTTTDRLMFDQVASVEHTAHNGVFTITAITVTGDRKVITEAEAPLDMQARLYAKMMEKPMIEPDPAEKLLHNN